MIKNSCENPYKLKNIEFALGWDDYSAIYTCGITIRLHTKSLYLEELYLIVKDIAVMPKYHNKYKITYVQYV